MLFSVDLRQSAGLVVACNKSCVHLPQPRSARHLPSCPAGLPAPVALVPGRGGQVERAGTACCRIRHCQCCKEEHGSEDVW